VTGSSCFPSPIMRSFRKRGLPELEWLQGFGENPRGDKPAIVRAPDAPSLPMSALFEFGLDVPSPDDDLTALRRRIAEIHRADEASTLRALIADARLAPRELAHAQALATTLAQAVREERSKAGGVDALMLEFSL